jgi:hypothetical protein
MTFVALNLLFPIVLAIHNVDEYSRYDDFIRAYHPRLSENSQLAASSETRRYY